MDRLLQSDLFTDEAVSCNDYSNIIQTTVIDVLDAMAPLRTRKKRIGRASNHWLSEEAVKAKRKRSWKGSGKAPIPKPTVLNIVRGVDLPMRRSTHPVRNTTRPVLTKPEVNHGSVGKSSTSCCIPSQNNPSRRRTRTVLYALHSPSSSKTRLQQSEIEFASCSLVCWSTHLGLMNYILVTIHWTHLNM